MSHTGTSAWWTDVQYLRDAAERTDEARRRADRADRADLAARRAVRERRSVDAEVAPAPRRRLQSDPPATSRRDRIDGTAVSERGSRGRVDVATVPDRGSRGRVDVATVPDRGSRGRVDVATVPDRGSRGRVDVATVPDRGSRGRVDVATVPDRDRHGRVDVATVPDGTGHGEIIALSGRRTVEIRGRTVPAPALPRSLDLDRRRPPRRVIERVGPRPDRLALWALLMGLVLILVAVGTADAATVAAVVAR
jgi:hypothetical protein